MERCKTAIITVNGRLIAALKPWEEEIKLVKKPEKEKTEEERKRTARVYRNASLVLSQGKRDNVSSYMLTATFRAPEGAQDCRPTSCTKDARRWICTKYRVVHINDIKGTSG